MFSLSIPGLSHLGASLSPLPPSTSEGSPSLAEARAYYAAQVDAYNEATTTGLVIGVGGYVVAKAVKGARR